MIRKLKKYFQDQQDGINRRLREAFKGMKQTDPRIEEVAFNREDEAEILAGIGLEEYIRTAGDEADFLIDEMVLETSIDKESPQFVSWCRAKSEKFSFEVNDTTLKELKATLDEGVKAGEGMNELTGRVNDLFESKKTWESRRIARTEMHKASMEGRRLANKRSSVTDGKRWITALDERVRSTFEANHLAMQGVAVYKNDMFVLPDGVHTDEPGLTGVARHDINCRCMSVPVVDMN